MMRHVAFSIESREISSACYGKTVLRVRNERARKKKREREKLARSLIRPPKACLSSRRLSVHELSPVHGSECGLSLGRPRGEVTEARRPSYSPPLPRKRVSPPIDRRPSRSLIGSVGIVMIARVLRVIDQSRIPRGRTARIRYVRGMPHPSHE